jgi:hypothetical protein
VYQERSLSVPARLRASLAFHDDKCGAALMSRRCCESFCSPRASDGVHYKTLHTPVLLLDLLDLFVNKALEGALHDSKSEFPLVQAVLQFTKNECHQKA